jgi:hypothetical protein
MANKDKPSRTELAISFVTLWAARLALATLAVAGGLHLLSGVDPIIAYPFVGIGVSFLLKETL